MNYIVNSLNNNLEQSEFFKNKYDLLKCHQAKSEFYLILFLGYLWNKNKGSLSHEEALDANKILLKKNLTIGSVIKLIETLDSESEIVDENSIHYLNHYRNTRNEEIGHGFTFSDATEKLIDEFKGIHESFSKIRSFIANLDYDLILVKTLESDICKGYKFTPDGKREVWASKTVSNSFNVDEVYIQYTNINSVEYYRLSPFIGIETNLSNTEFYIFGKINDTRSGQTSYNYLSKSGRKETIEWEEFRNLYKMSDGNVIRSNNGTIMNVFSVNHSKYITIGAQKSEIKKFIVENRSNVCINIWGHGGVGKTATVQSICEDFVKSDLKYFTHIVFLSAKNTKFNTETGSVESLSYGERIDDYESLIKNINLIIFEELVFDEKKIINNSGKNILIVIDDYETFANEEKEKIISFISNLHPDKFKVVITTRATIEIKGSYPVSINELDPNNTRAFFLKLLNVNHLLTELNKNTIIRNLSSPDKIKKLHFITDGRPLFIEYFVNILNQVDFERAMSIDIKSSAQAIEFLFGKIYENLSLIAKDIFCSIGQMQLDNDFGGLIEHLKYISIKEDDKSANDFINGILELEKYKIIQIDEDRKFFKIWTREILSPIKHYFQLLGEGIRGEIIKRASQISLKKDLDIETAIFQDAEIKRFSGKAEQEISSAYRQVINRKNSPLDLKLKAIFSLGNYYAINSSPDEPEKIISIFEEYEVRFSQTPEFIERYSYLLFGLKDKKYRQRSVDILLRFIVNPDNKKNLGINTELKFYGLLVTRVYTMEQEKIKKFKENRYTNRIKSDEYQKKILEYKSSLKNCFNKLGLPLYRKLQSQSIEKLSKNEKHFVFGGLYHLIEVCLKLQDYQNAQSISDFALSISTENNKKDFQKQRKLLPKGENLRNVSTSDQPVLESIIIDNQPLIVDESTIEDNIINEFALKLVRCRVETVNEKVVFIKLIETNQDATLHISEFSHFFIDSLSDYFKVGDFIEAVVIGKDPYGKVSVSLKRCINLLFEGQELNVEIIKIREANNYAIALINNYYLPARLFKRDISMEYVSQINSILSPGKIVVAKVKAISLTYGVTLTLLDLNLGEKG